jgi:hypothetical protein
MYTLRNLDTATGVQLDGLGQIVDEDRKGASDDLYRAILRAKVIALRAKGRLEEMVSVISFLAGDTAIIDVSELYPASLRFQAFDDNVLITGIPAALERLLRLAKPAGVSLSVIASYVASGETFTLADYLASVPQLDGSLGFSVWPPIFDWSPYGSASIDLNVGTAPNGTMTAHRLNMDSSSEFSGIEHIPGTNDPAIDVDPTEVGTFRVYLRKEAGTQDMRLNYFDKAGSLFQGTDFTVDDTWQEYSIPFNSGSGGSSFIVDIERGGAQTTTSVLFWRAQIDVVGQSGGKLSTVLGV